jgi:hypothetical protein
MSTPIKKKTREEVMAWAEANPEATTEEIRAYALGMPAPGRFKQMAGTVGRNIEAAGRSALQMVTGGFSDEIGAGIAALSPNVTYKDAVAAERQTLAEAPIVGRMAGETAGIVGAALTAPLAMGSMGALGQLLGRGATGSLGARAALSGAAGAAGAEVMGIGTGTGTPLDRAQQAAGPSLTAGLLSAALPVGGQFFRSAGNALGVRPGMVPPKREAADLVNEALVRDKATPDGVVAQAKKNPSVPQSPLELAGDNTRDLALAAQSRSNTARTLARDIVEERMEGEHARYIQRLRESLNPEDADILQRLEELKDMRAVNATRNFEGVLDNTITDAKVASFFREPEVRQAYEKFRQNQLTRLAAGKIGPEDVPPEIYVYGTTKGGKKGVRLGTVEIPLRAFHVVQQALNDAIKNGLKKGEIIPADRAKALRDALEVHMDKVGNDLFPEYGAGRRMFRDDSSVIDELNAGAGKKIKDQHGRKIPDFATAPFEEVRNHVGELRRAMKGTGEEAQLAAERLEHYMMGTYSYFRSKLNKMSGSAANAYLDKPEVRQRISLLMPENADEAIRALKHETRIRANRGMSRKGTAIAGDEHVPPGFLDVMLGTSGLGSGHKYAAASAAARLIRGEAKMSDRTANAVMENLFKGAGGLEELIAGMEDLKRASEAQARRRLRNAGATAGASAAATSEYRN